MNHQRKFSELAVCALSVYTFIHIEFGVKSFMNGSSCNYMSNVNLCILCAFYVSKVLR